jgi:ATP-dependent protease Clp ATPase subunit
MAAVQRGIVYIDGVDESGVHEPLRQLLAGPTVVDLDRIAVYTTHILFLCGGRFSGIEGEDLATFGLPPELVRCWQVIVRVDRLDEETLARIASVVDLSRFSDHDD